MIKEFSFGNFRSFKEIQSLNMTASKIKEHTENNIISINDKQSLLKSKAVYGANASGKSNIVKALVTFIRIVNSSVKEEKILRLVDNFQLSNETDDKPSFFQLIFEIDNIQYRYGFETTEDEIKNEWLFGVPNEREVVLFIREKNEITDISEKHFIEGHKLKTLFDENNGENEIFRNNSLFLSAVAAMNGKISKQIVSEISSITVLNGLEDEQLFNVAGTELKDKEKKDKIIKFLQLADTGINSVDTFKVTKDNLSKDAPDDIRKEIEKDNEINFILSKHFKYNAKKKKIGEVALHFVGTQSQGTIKMFELSSFILDAINEGKPIIIDEFDARFHPLISKRIVELFNSKDNKKSQLIYITHDTNLLSNELLRRDQIDFVEKDKYGASHLYSLVEFKGIRNTALLQKDYIKGKFGAIPFLGDFNQLFKTEENA